MPPMYQAPMMQAPMMQAPMMQAPVVMMQAPQAPVQQVITALPDYGHTPVAQTCPHCKGGISTRVKHEVGDGTWAGVCCMLFVFFPCWWLPLVIDDCKDAIHECPNCNQVVGRKNYTG